MFRKAAAEAMHLEHGVRYTLLKFRASRCTGRGGCGFERRAQLRRYIAPIFTAPGGSPHITLGGFRCDLGRDVNKLEARPPKGCDSSPSLSVDLQRFDDTVEVVQNPDGSTTFIFK